MIDFHVHIGKLNVSYPIAFAEDMMAACGKPASAISVSVTKLLQEMDEAGVEKAVLLAFNAKRALGVHVSNEYVLDVCSTYPDRFLPFLSFDSGAPIDSNELQRLRKKGAYAGYKLAYGYAGASPTHPDWNAVYDNAERNKLPILAHMGFTPAKGAKLKYCLPSLLCEIADYYPKLQLVIAHLGWPWVEETMDLLSNYSYIYTDLSIFIYYQPFETVVSTVRTFFEKGIAHKLIWGTDYPFCTFQEGRGRLERLKTRLNEQGVVDRDDTIWQMIESGNARRLLNISL